MAGGADRRACPQQEAWRLVAAFTQRVVENLRDGVATRARRRCGARGLGRQARWAPIAVRAAAAPARAEVGAMKHGASNARDRRWSPAAPASSARTWCAMLGSQDKAPPARARAQRAARLAEGSRAGRRDRVGLGDVAGRRRARRRGRRPDLSPGRVGLAQARRTRTACTRSTSTARAWCARRRRAPGVHAHRDGVDQRHRRGLAPRRRRRRRGDARRRSTSSRAGPTTPASSTRRRPRAAPAATRWSW